MVGRKEPVNCGNKGIETAWLEAEMQDFTRMKVELIIKDRKQSYAL